MLFTVGHSDLGWVEFCTLTADLDLILDIRSHPGSHWPQFQQEYMQRELGSRYEWWPALGGWTAAHLPLQAQYPQVDIAAYAQRKFPKQHIARSLPAGPAWTNQGLLDYSYWMTTPEFLHAAEQLLVLSGELDVGICCAEVLWWKCHRSMIADYAVYRWCDAVHLQPRLTVHSLAIGNRLQRYPLEVRHSWPPAQQDLWET